MKKFILFFRGGVAGQEDLKPWIEELKKKEIFVYGAPLMEDGKIAENKAGITHDFLFDINENARAFVILSANSTEEVVELSKNCPVFINGGNITIRPINNLY